MTQVKIDETGDLYFIFKECDDIPVSYRLDNQSEFYFVDDECIGFSLLDFERKLNRGRIPRDDISLDDLSVNDDVIFFTITVANQSINGKIDFSSLNNKL